MSGLRGATTVIVGTRGSKLALAQTHEVIGRLKGLWSDVAFEERIIKTAGDKHAEVALAQVAAVSGTPDGKGVFTKAIEDRLLAGDADIAVHSAKDLPTELPDGLRLGAFLQREDARDVLVLREGAAGSSAEEAHAALCVLREGAVVGTSSLRRQAQLARRRPDLRFVEMRGNLDTRLRKLREQELDAIVVAAAGLNRLGIGGVRRVSLPLDVCLPAAGQGAVAVEVRASDASACEIVAALDHPATAAAVRAERMALGALEGGCRVPVGLHGCVEEGGLRLSGVVLAPGGGNVIRGEAEGSIGEPEAVGRRLAEELLAEGAAEVLAEVRA